MANVSEQVNQFLQSRGINPKQGDKFPLFEERKQLFGKLGLSESLGKFVGSAVQNSSMLNQLQKGEQTTGVNINPNNLGNFTSMIKQGLQNFTGQTGQTGQTVSTGGGGAGQTLETGAGAGGVNPNMRDPIFPQNPTQGMRVSLGPGKASYRYDSETNQWLETSMYDSKHATAGGTGGGDVGTGGTGGTGDTLAGTDATGLLPTVPTGGDLAQQALEQVQRSATFPLQQEAQEAQKSAVQLGAQRQTQDFIKNIASRGLFFSGAKSEGVSNIEVDKLANLLNIDRSFAMLMAQGLETAATDIAKEAAKGRTEAIDSLAALGFAINPITGKVEPTLQAQQQQASQQIQQQQLQLQQQAAAKPITEEVDGNLYQYDQNTGQWGLAIQGQQAFEAPKTLTTDQGIMQWNEQTGGWESTGLTSGKTGAGTPIPGSITPEQLSPLANAVYQGTIKLTDITPTQRAEIAPELNAVGYSNVIARETKQDVSFIKNEMVNVLASWRKVPDNLKGVIQGRLGTAAKAGEWSKEVAGFNAAKGIIGMALTRLFEKGRISDQDRIFYMSLMPNVNMNEESAKAGAAELIRLLEEKLEVQIDTLGGGGVTESKGDTGDTGGTSSNDPLGIR